MINKANWEAITAQLAQKAATLVAVSKKKSKEDIATLHALGQLDFGENYVQELIEKQPQLPTTIRWHFIGHLQTNKVRQIAPFVSLIHSVDRFKLLLEINRQGEQNARTIDVLLQMHIATEESKFGMTIVELFEFMEYYRAQKASLKNVRIRGLMGMASFIQDPNQVKEEFASLGNRFEVMKRTDFIADDKFNILSMGMSGDYELALEEGSNMVRIGSLIFGER